MEIHNESIVSYETAKLLKSAGFNDTCRAFWKVCNGKTNLYNCDKRQRFDYCCNNMLEMYNDSSEENVAAPTLQMARIWLYEKTKLDVLVYLNGKSYVFVIYRDKSPLTQLKMDSYDTYDEAMEHGIKYCLVHLRHWFKNQTLV